MTETTSVISVENQLGGPRNTGSAGMLVPGVECQILSVDTLERLPPKQLGEICVRGPNIMQGKLLIKYGLTIKLLENPYNRTIKFLFFISLKYVYLNWMLACV